MPTLLVWPGEAGARRKQLIISLIWPWIWIVLSTPWSYQCCVLGWHYLGFDNSWNNLRWKLHWYLDACGFLHEVQYNPGSFLVPLLVNLVAMLENANKLSGFIAGERQLFYLWTQSSSYPFLFPWFLSLPHYPWSSCPFISSIHPRASSISHHHLLIQFTHPAMNSAQAL